MQYPTKIAFAIWILTLIFAFGILGSNAPGDRDSHAFMFLRMLLGMLPLGIAIAIWSVLHAHRQHRGRIFAWTLLSLFLLPAVALATVILR